MTMASIFRLKILLLAVSTLAAAGWLVAGAYSPATADTFAADAAQSAPAMGIADDYVGSETCQACHEDQFKAFAKTKHARLGSVSSWKDKAHGCESCHGPGKAHVEGGGDKTKITSFVNMNAKQASETCLACHAGKESHNNFRRGEHWRNDVGCTTCHSAHGEPTANSGADSAVYVSDVTRQNPGQASTAMLKMNEPQLCMSCHNETKSQFSKPFHHKVLEGTMKCTSCHNPHGGFESKQAKLAVGADSACIKCHADKQGPFAFEHGPLKTEGCTACHTPHGSSNPKMLSRSSVRQLCLECHSSLSNADPGAPQAPHNQTQTRYLSCTVCHARIHGSNSSKYFFR